MASATDAVQLIVIDVVTSLERDVGEEPLEVGQGGDRHAFPADLARARGDDRRRSP